MADEKTPGEQGSDTGNSRQQAPEGFIEMNLLDAESLGITDGDWVRVISRRGAIKARVKLTERCSAGMIFSTFHFKEVPVNLLTNDALDPIGKIPEYKVCAVRVEKVE